MTSNEQEIRALIEGWAAAVRAGDLAAVLEDHAADIVMFDVPPPYQGARGLDEYRATWPGFFEWQASGAVFEIESLDVTAGEDVAFAFALLRCGMAEEFPASPTRLRLTLGLRKEDNRWLVSHEHHSFPSEDSPTAESEVRDLT
ncbi:nuclear transport factor 2 family protein [Kribbella sp. CA-294648]|uniref:nuclear transport factor 2 family protein n=1 Tax=Kribbella sp. CA-294648 TaxID=3239948 RepID=UPI003D94C284